MGPERLQEVFISTISICLHCSTVGDICEKETNRRKGEKEESERRTRAICHSVEGFKIVSITIMNKYNNFILSL